MGSKKLLVTAGVIAVVAAGAILVPSIAAGVPLAGLLPASTTVATHDGPGNNGHGNAFGHSGDSEDSPGNNGKTKQHSGQDDSADDAAGSADGKAWGHQKDSPDFPGNHGRGQGHQKGDSSDSSTH